jgi:hypothetical protein
MPRYMLNTNLSIRVLRDRPPALRERSNQEAPQHSAFPLLY